jgi:Methyltransferase domain
VTFALRANGLLLGALWFGMTSAASEADYQPELAQPGKDVVWVPTPDALVNRMLDLAKVSASDHVIDLGSGDGRLVMMAAKRGARAHGIEYSAGLVELSKRTAQQAGLAAKATFAKADLFDSDLSAATVITLFLSPEINLKLRPKLLNLKPGTRIVSNTFNMGDWLPDDKAASTDDERSVYYRTAMLWIVPAKVSGAWQSAQALITFSQRYQMIDGTLQAKGAATPITGARLRGDQISFSAHGARYTGAVSGSIINGTITVGGASQGWRATRAR